ncbi:MAG: glycosyltransferase [Hyphomicrobiaceae bacterium]|nr:glycosyltransferase [Hyphomicrobiaceae bacterium]
MATETLAAALIFAPLLFVVATIYVLGPLLPITKTWSRLLIFSVVWLVVARYVAWRVVDTVLPVDGTWYQIMWVYFCFAVELFALVDALILYLGFLRSRDRRAEADVGEARLRAQTHGGLPSVDVFIATYNESLEILEKTITGALCLDYPNYNVWVLDDGRRPWLKDLCAAKGAGYLTRPDNAHAKAGNINHALTQTSADFVAVFDADFVVQRNFLLRTMGFFDDPRIGIVQVPHAFYNNDPMQTNLAVRKTLPDDQRFFFEAIMPSRDGWDAAFCCGSNSVTRRDALRSIGDALPTESITEDMLLSLKLLRKGYVTRYLSEHLAFGLAPESLTAFFIQRRRWARGAMQILFLADGPLGPGLNPMQRLLFLPTHWLSQSLMLLTALIAPIVFMWTGILPLVNVSLEAVAYYLLPMLLAMAGGICLYAPNLYFPLAAQVLGTFQSFKILPTALATLIKPWGHAFKVTPKGAEAGGADYEAHVFWSAAALLSLTMCGILINALPEWRIVSQAGLVPIVAIWSCINIGVLFLVCMMCVQEPARRGEERFSIDEAVWMAGDRAYTVGALQDISLSGARITLLSNGPLPDSMRLFLAEVGYIRSHIVWQRALTIGVKFDLPPSIERDLLIRKLFTSGFDATAVTASAWSSTSAVLVSMWSQRSTISSGATETPVSTAIQKLPAVTLVVAPVPQLHRLSELVKTRRVIAA